MTRTGEMPAGPPPGGGPAEPWAGAGSLCLDFVATRHEPRHTELLPDVDGLSAWFAAVGLPAPVGGFVEQDLRDAHELRTAVDQAARRLLAGRAPGAEAVRCLNTFARHATPIFLMRPSGRERVAAEELDARASLSVIARDAVNLLTGPDLGRLRECDGCASLFYDRSPSGRRRWCSMQRCGEKVASASYRRRRAATAHA